LLAVDVTKVQNKLASSHVNSPPDEAVQSVRRYGNVKTARRDRANAPVNGNENPAEPTIYTDRPVEK
jgi:hypothetical protein